MFIFILQMFMMVSLAAVLYMLARVLPRIDDADVKNITASISFRRLVGYLETVDEWFVSLSQKFLRRTHIVILKLDNIVGKKLNSFKKNNGTETSSPFVIEKEEKKEEGK